MERAFGLEIPRTLEEVCRPDRLALIVYDMQAGIVVQLPDGAEVTRRVLDVVDAARAGGFRLFYTRHMSLPKEVAGVSQLSMALAWQRVEHVEQARAPFLRDSPPFQLVAELTPLPTEVIFDKITMSAFVGTPLDIAMRDCGLNAFAIVGIALEVGIEPTVHHAMDLGDDASATVRVRVPARAVRSGSVCARRKSAGDAPMNLLKARLNDGSDS
jgi:biuret amidohydrolase